MADEHRTPVTVLGLGLMGTALAAAFVAAGHPTTVWNRSAGKAYALVAQGAVEAAGVAEAAAASPVAVACLLDYDALHGFALVGSEKIPAAALLPFAEAWITHVALPGIAGAAQQVDAGQYGNAVSTVALDQVGLAKLVKASKAQGIRHPKGAE